MRFDLLDGLRGLAAFAVMLVHYTEHNGLHKLPGAWIAVDLFFVLSGFVIAYSYGAKLIAGMPMRTFLLTRLIRLGPLYLLAMLVGLAAVLLTLRAVHPANMTAQSVSVATLLSLAWLPYFNDIAWPVGIDASVSPTFPLNEPSWSLFFELFANVAFFLYVARFRSFASFRMVAFWTATFVFCTFVLHQYNPGWAAPNFIYGFPRVMAEFFGGALLFQLGCHRWRVPRLISLAVVAAALASFFAANVKILIVSSVTLVPLAIALASSLQIDGALRSASRLLGRLSYPLYVMHFPIYMLAFQLPGVRALKPWLQTALLGAVAIAFAMVLAVLDERVRARLMARLAPRDAALVRQAA